MSSVFPTFIPFRYRLEGYGSSLIGNSLSCYILIIAQDLLVVKGFRYFFY